MDVSLEGASTAERERIFRLGAWYAPSLADEEIEEIFAHDEVQVQDYIKGIVTARIRGYKYEAAEERVRFSKTRSLHPGSRTQSFKTYSMLLLTLASESSPSKAQSCSN
jgi:hypothetical protein